MLPSGSPLFQRIATDLCASVSQLLRQTMNPVVPFLRGESGDHQGLYGDTEVTFHYGPDEKTQVSLRMPSEELVFRQSRHVPGALVVERVIDGNPEMTISCAVTRRARDLVPFHVLLSARNAETGAQLGFRLMPRFGAGEDVSSGVQILSEDAQQSWTEPDFISFLSGYESVLEDLGPGALSCVNASEGLWRGLAEAVDEGNSVRGLSEAILEKGYLLSLQADGRTKRVFRRVFGLEPDRIQLSGWTCSTLTSLLNGLHLIVLKDGSVLRTFP